MLRLRTFGGLALDQSTRLDGAASRRRPLALLALLAVAGDRGMTRDKIAAFLWPESDDERARNSLSQALSSLRRDLGAGEVVIGSAELRLNAEVITSDLQEFERLIEAGNLLDAVALYSGPFLDGVFLRGSAELEHWVEQQRQRFQQLYVGALDQLADRATAAGDGNAAVKWRRQRAEATPLDGRAALSFMQALAAIGNANGALQHFRIHETLLRSELDAGAQADVVAFAHRLRAAGVAAKRDEGVTPATSAMPAREPVLRATRPANRRLWLIGAGFALAIMAVVSGFMLHRTSAAASSPTSIPHVSTKAVDTTVASATPAGIPTSASAERMGVSRVVVGRIVPIAASAETLYFDAAISPDGNHVAYAAGSPGRMRIFIRPLAGSAAILVSEGIEGNHRWPRWSPDGARITFQAASPDSPAGRIYQVPAFGGSPELLVERGSFASWSRDGALAYASAGIWVIPPRGGPAVHIDSTSNATWPSWSPDGLRLVFAADDQHFLGSSYGGVAKNPVWVMDATGHNKRKLYAADALHAAPVWAPDGRSVLFVSDQDGLLDVYRQGIDGDSLTGAVERVTVGAHVFTFSLSRDGSRMAYNTLHSDEGSNIWAAAVGDGLTPFSSARAVTHGRQQIESFSVSHDGRWLAFDSKRDADGNVHIYKMPLKGTTVRGEPIRLTHHEADDYDPRWSPDDKEIAFHRNINGNRDVYVIRADGRNETQVTHDTLRKEYHPDWSADGKSLAYASPSGGDRGPEVFTVSRDASGRWSEPTLVTEPRRGGNIARWSPTGRELALSGGAVRILSLADNQSRDALTREQLGEAIPSLYWGRDTNELYMQTRDSNRVVSFWRFDRRTSTPTRVLTLTDPLRRTNQLYFDVHGNNLFFTVTPAGSEVFVAALAWRR